MKKQTSKQRRRSAALARRRWKREWRSRNKAHARRSLGLAVGDASRGRLISLMGPSGVSYGRMVGEPRPVPAVVSLRSNTEATLSFLQEVREGLIRLWTTRRVHRRRWRTGQSSKGGRPPTLRSYWDFTTIEHIGADAALVLASEYDRVRRRGGALPKAVDFENWRPEVRAVLEGIGFLELVGIVEAGAPVVGPPDWKVLKFIAHGEANGTYVAALLDELGMGTVIDDAELYGAIFEALLNTKHHAYPEGRTFPPPHVPNWWLSAFVHHSERRIRISVFDQGLTIPRTLPTWGRYPVFSRAWRRLLRSEPDPGDDRYDGEAIAIAMATGRTATGLAYRGKGLAFMESILNRCADGEITIRSRRGAYYRRKGGKPHYATTDATLHGTLVTWDLKL